MAESESIDNMMKLQSAEFDALTKLCASYKVLQSTPIVDDDYPEMRHYYESALQGFIRALRDNGRFPESTQKKYSIHELEVHLGNIVPKEWPR